MGRFLGGLSSLTAPQLAAQVVRAATIRSGVDPAEIDEVILGHVFQAGAGQAPARLAAILAGLDESIPAVTINKVCGSGMKSVMLAAQAIRASDGQLFVAGGMESMSNAPHLIPKIRAGFRIGNKEIVDSVIYDGLWCAVGDEHMGTAAERIAAAFDVSRDEQDQFSIESHQKAISAIQAGRFDEEIVPIQLRGSRDEVVLFQKDETPRSDTSLAALARLRPAFAASGTVTAGNAPGLSDGAAALIVASTDYAQSVGIEPMARITGYSSAAVEPGMLFAAPPVAIGRLLERTGRQLEDFDLIELNEAFAAQVIANHRELRWDWSKLNVNGGAIALGHPIGSSGARILVTLIHALRARGGGRGLASLCLGGGGAVAMSIEV